VEREVLLELVHRGEVVLVTRFGELLESRVRAHHVRGVVLAVVQLHDLAADVRGQCAVVVVEIGQGVDSHVVSF